MTGSQKRPHGRLKVEPATSLNVLSQLLYLIHHHGNVMSNETSCFDYGFLFISFHRVAKETLLYIYIWCQSICPRFWALHLPAVPACWQWELMDNNAAKYLRLPKKLMAQLFSHEFSTEESCHNKSSNIAVLSLLTQKWFIGKISLFYAGYGGEKQITSPMDD